MPFAGPETALAVTIDSVGKGIFIRQKTARLKLNYALREFNDFHEDSTT